MDIVCIGRRSLSSPCSLSWGFAHFARVSIFLENGTVISMVTDFARHVGESRGLRICSAMMEALHFVRRGLCTGTKIIRVLRFKFGS